MKKSLALTSVLSIVMVLAMIVSSFATANNLTVIGSNSQNMLDVMKQYCCYYGVDFKNSSEFKNELKEIITERSINGKIVFGGGNGNNGKKKRDIPKSEIGDIIWTDNPTQPFNHVGLYTEKKEITEALFKGVKSRKTGTQQEYPFRTYYVRKQKKDERYSKSDRQAVADWTTMQIGKKYDSRFFDNKKNTKESNKLFNCSELVWKSWKYNDGSAHPDLDANGGDGVYPNNIKNSRYTVFIEKG